MRLVDFRKGQIVIYPTNDGEVCGEVVSATYDRVQIEWETGNTSVYESNDYHDKHALNQIYLA